MSESIQNIAFITPKNMAAIQQHYGDQANRILAEFAEEINEQNGMVTVIVSLQGSWHFDFADISTNLSDRIIARLESDGVAAANLIKPYTKRVRGY